VYGRSISGRTTAVRDGDHYVIKGMKRFITGADEADFAQVFAATDLSKGSRGGISGFLVDMDSPGVKLLSAQETMMDDRPWEIAFEDVWVPVRNRIGSEGEGFKFAQNWISVGRIRHRACGIRVMERCLELGASHAKQRGNLRPAAVRVPIGAVDAGRYLCRASLTPIDGLPRRVERRSRRRRSPRGLYMQIYRRHEILLGRRPLPAGP